MFDDFEKKYDHAEKSGEGNAQLNKMKSQFYSAHENLITIYQDIPFYSYLPTKGMYGPILFTITVNCENIKFNNIKVYASINNCRPSEKNNNFIFKIKGKNQFKFKFNHPAN